MARFSAKFSVSDVLDIRFQKMFIKRKKNFSIFYFLLYRGAHGWYRKGQTVVIDPNRGSPFSVYLAHVL